MRNRKRCYLLSGEVGVLIKVLLGEDHRKNSMRPTARFIHVGSCYGSEKRERGGKGRGKREKIVGDNNQGINITDIKFLR